jgi:hypothetical protein
MMQTIKTRSGDYHFEPVNLYYRRKKIDKKVSRENLLIVRDILNKSKLRWGLIFGTLLGALREGDFIDHDEDTDIYIFNEDRKKLIDNVFEFEKHGFRVARYGGFLMSIIRNDDYIDFYFFKKVFFGRRCEGFFVSKVFFSTQATVTFLEAEFPTVFKPKEYLSYVYGENWRIPKTNSHAAQNYFYWKSIMKKIFSMFNNFVSYLKKK